MVELKIYWSGIEYKYGKESPSYGKLQGGFVYGFVQANDARDALEKFDERLKEENLIPFEVEFVSVYDIEKKWESEEDTDYYCQLYDEAKETASVILDDFYAYKSKT